MKPRFSKIFLAIVLTPFILGISFFAAEKINSRDQKMNFITDTRKNNNGVTYKGIKIDWTFCPDWKYKPLLFSAQEYLVFMFHYTNNNRREVQLMPSYELVSNDEESYPANEEISMYIEDRLEDELGVADETSITFALEPGSVKHYIASFERTSSLENFYVDVDLFRDVILRIHYTKGGNLWINNKNEWVKKYKGRG